MTWSRWQCIITTALTSRALLDTQPAKADTLMTHTLTHMYVTWAWFQDRSTGTGPGMIPGQVQTQFQDRSRHNSWTGPGMFPGQVQACFQDRPRHDSWTGPGMIPGQVQAQFQDRSRHDSWTGPGMIPGQVQAWFQNRSRYDSRHDPRTGLGMIPGQAHALPLLSRFNTFNQLKTGTAILPNLNLSLAKTTTTACSCGNWGLSINPYTRIYTYIFQNVAQMLSWCTFHTLASMMEITVHYQAS